MSICSRTAIMTTESERADRVGSRRRQREAGRVPMTAFKSDGAMHLRGKAAKRWIAKIKKEKEEQDRMRKAMSVWTGESR